jgi:hypothetical protein
MTKPCDLCGNKNRLEEHHINGRNIPDPNHPSNICAICASCHTLIHEGHIIIEGWMQTTEGLKLIHHSVDGSSFSGWDSKPYIVPS